jgi:hypothetical protein
MTFERHSFSLNEGWSFANFVDDEDRLRGGHELDR